MRGTWSREEEEALLTAFIDARKTAAYHSGRQLTAQGWNWIETQLAAHATTPKTRASLTSKINHLMRTYDLFEYLRGLQGAKVLDDGRIELDEEVWDRIFEEKPTDKDFLRQIRVSGCRHLELCGTISAERTTNVTNSGNGGASMPKRPRSRVSPKPTSSKTSRGRSKALQSVQSLPAPATTRHHQARDDEDEEEQSNSDTEDEVLDVSDSPPSSPEMPLRTSFISPQNYDQTQQARKMRRLDAPCSRQDTDGNVFVEQEPRDIEHQANEDQYQGIEDEDGNDQGEEEPEQTPGHDHQHRSNHAVRRTPRTQQARNHREQRQHTSAPPPVGNNGGSRLLSDATEQSINGLLIAATKYLEWKLAEERWREQKKRRNGRTNDDLH